MTMRFLGAFLIFAGCGSFGFSMAAAYRNRQRDLEQFQRALEWMRAELSCRMPELGTLCRGTAAVVTGPVQRVFRAMAEEVDRQIAPDPAQCMAAALARQELPAPLRQAFSDLGENLGRYDLPEQLRGLEQAQLETARSLQQLRQQRENRIRSYETLGLCAGASLAILLI